MLTRRFILAAAAATSAAAAMPVRTALAAVSVASPRPAWIIGTDGDFNFEIIRAQTREEAIAEWIAQETGLTACGCRPDGWGACDFCTHSSRDIYRAKHFDALEKPTAADWIRAGFGHTCSRCDYETFGEDGGQAVGDEAVCDDCMTLDDWDKVDPERAAEIRGELDED